MFCAKCGNDVGDGAAGTCSRCGAQLPATGQSQQAGAGYPGQAQPRPAQPGPAQPGPVYPGQAQSGPAQPPGPGYSPAPGGGQYGAPPAGGQYAPPPPAQQYGAPPAGQQYGAPPYGAPATGQQPGAAQGGWGGAPAPGQAPQGWTQPQPSRSPAPKFAFDAKRWTPGDITVGVASLVVLISLFLPWFNASVAGFGSGSESGLDQHGWLWLVFILSLVILGFLVLKAGFSDLPFTMPFQQEVILLAAAGLNLLLVVIAFLLKPTLPAGIGSGVSIGWDVGAFIGLIAAIVAVIPLVPAARNLASGPGSPGSGQHR